MLYSDSGKYPVISNTSINNGIGGYTDKMPTENGNTITFSDTSTSEAIFYQPDAFVGYPHVQGLYPCVWETQWKEASLIYLTSIMKKIAVEKGFSYGNKFTRKIAANFTVSLPINVDGDVDFAYMEKYIETVEKSCFDAFDKFLADNELSDYELTDEDKKVLFEKKEYKKFKLGIAYKEDNGLFKIVKGKRLTKKNMIPGNTAFVGSSSTNNGITAYIGNKENIHKGGHFTVAYNGAVGSSFYHDDDFIASDDVNVFYNDSISKKASLYIMTITTHIGQKYNWSSKWDKETMENTYILLPTDSDNNIDFDYMERYITAVEKLVVAKAVAERNKLKNSDNSG